MWPFKSFYPVAAKILWRSRSGINLVLLGATFQKFLPNVESALNAPCKLWDLIEPPLALGRDLFWQDVKGLF